MEKFIIYQLLMRVFGNRNENCTPDGSLLLNGCGKFSSINGDVLWHLRTMSVKYVYYTGVIRCASKSDFSQYGIPLCNPSVVKGCAGSPFAITDYYDVCPDLADNPENRMKEFEALLQRTHNMGIKVIIDFVPNHLSREYNSVCRPSGTNEDFGENDDRSVAFNPQNNFYYLPGQSLKIGTYKETPARATGNDCFSAFPSESDWYETAKLNYGVDYQNGCAPHFNPVPKTWRMMLDVLKYWSGKGVDGFRCDMADMVPVEFWKWAIKQTKDEAAKKSNNGNVVFIAESYNPNNYNALRDSGFDLLYDKVGLYDTLKHISRGEENAEAVTSCWQNLGESQDGMLNFIENHDEQRVASKFNLGSAQKALPELCVSLMLNKAPFMLYFGQEFGEAGMNAEGFSGLDGRTSIYDYCSVPSVARFLNKKLHLDEQSLELTYVKLLHIASNEPCISKGDTFDLEYANKNLQGVEARYLFVFARKYGNSIIFIAADFAVGIDGNHAKTADVCLPAHFFDFWKVEERECSGTDLLSGEKIRISLCRDGIIKMPLTKNGISIIKI